MRLWGVACPFGHHRRGSRGSPSHRCRHRIRRVERVGVQARGPLPRRGRQRVRATITTAAHIAIGDTRSSRRVDHRHSPRPHQARSRRRQRNDRLAPRPAPPGDGVGIHDPPLPRRCRPRHPRTTQETTRFLHPVPSRVAQRMLASRLHPLRPEHPRRHRDPHLARRSLPLRALHRAYASDRSDRDRHVHSHHRGAGHPLLHPHRQWHGVHHPPLGRRRPQRLREPPRPPRCHPEELTPRTIPPPAAKSNVSNKR